LRASIKPGARHRADPDEFWSASALPPRPVQPELTPDLVPRQLPFYPMARLIRAGLTDGMVTDVGGPFLVVGVWALLGSGLTAWAVGRRH
jgi:hypothetical protein